ncbi:MAG: hypothetical protein QOJ00_1895 [Actinomycetota bacterium]|jgi:murein DD-endopeptidase MepM/ murein hydrolase activator NlpD
MTADRFRLSVYALVTALALGLLAPAAAASSSKNAQQVQKARELKALQASDTELLNAVKALDGQVAEADAQTQNGRQSVRAAQAAASAAQSRLAIAENAMTRLRGSLVKRAVEEYTRPQKFAFTQSSTEDINAASRRKALLDSVTANDNDVLDQLHATRDDLLRQRAAAEKARQVASARQAALETELRQLLRDKAAKGRLSAALDKRIQEVQSEAAALAGDETNIRGILSGGSTAVGKVSGSGLMWPLKGRLTSGFGYRWGRLHAGIDIAAPKGTPIHAAKAGTVVFAGQMRGYGNVVIIDHGGGLSTLYGHQSRLGSSRGQRVAQGQVIGFVGSTGHSTGNHCHFETRINGTPQNPRRYLP